MLPADTFVLKVHVAQREELVGGRARHWVHEEREVARLRQRCLAAVAHAHCQVAADAVVVRCLEERASSKETWQLPSERPLRAASRDIARSS